MIRNRQNQTIGAQMVASLNGAAYVGTVTVYVTIDAGAQAIGSVGSGICTAEGNGYYTYRPTQTETDGDLIAFTFIGTGAIPATIQVATITESQEGALVVSGPGGGLTGADLIASAMKTLGTLAAGETPTADEQADGLLRLTDLLDAWGTQRLFVYYLLRTTQTLTANVSSYTIGSGGAINIVRPVTIDHAGLIIDTSASIPVERPLTVFTDQQWQAIPQKTLTSSLSRGVYYDFGWVNGLATVQLWPIPTVGTTALVLYTPQALTSMALSTQYTFPPGYARLLRYALARDLADEYGGWDQKKEMMFGEAMADVKRANFRLADLAIDRALIPYGGYYDINSDGVL
jgi:hypothetical protein